MTTILDDGPLIDCGNGFHSVRGTFRAGGVLDVGTQCALVELEPGRFVFLDSYTLPDGVLDEVMRMTDGGARVEAVLNLHPFHTLHCAWMHRAFPRAKMFGTQRHKDKLPKLPWQETRCEDEALAERYGEWFDFSVPQGTALICDSETVHFASVLALHRASGVVHVDDTLTWLEKGFPLSLLPMTGRLMFHPTLDKALEKRAGAAGEFIAWAKELASGWAETQVLACAHNAVVKMAPGEFERLVGEALERVMPVLKKHRARWG